MMDRKRKDEACNAKTTALLPFVESDMLLNLEMSNSLEKGEYEVVDCGFEALNYDFETAQFLPDRVTFRRPDNQITSVPFLHRLKQNILPNANLVIDGVVLNNAENFRVDLCSLLMSPRDNVLMKNIAFHLNPRFSTNCVIRNSFIDYEWGQEEIRTFRRNPLKKGSRFLLEIYVSPSHLLVAVNGSHFCEYSHRVPYNEINSIEINGDIILNKVELTTSNHYPMISPDATLDQTALEVPIVQKFSKSLTLPRTIVIAGTVYLLPFGFHVNLQSGSYVYPHPVIPFHMSVRWRPCEDDVIIFNSWTDDGWDDEVVMPMCNIFQPGADFLMELTITRNGFLGTLNAIILIWASE
ncbi:GLECT [Nesidiocoris tenuis]|uniref:Galectin n=1 Tax=Nesidiocoris tenuis TaxID=355587 RepID=A0ABN7ARP8_9HEMI|nr:GLECT [Nesidiocoris tenuis]